MKIAFRGESDVRKLEWITKTVEIVRSDAYFMHRISDMNMMFNYYLLIYQNAQVLFETWSQNQEIKGKMWNKTW